MEIRVDLYRVTAGLIAVLSVIVWTVWSLLRSKQKLPLLLILDARDQVDFDALLDECNTRGWLLGIYIEPRGAVSTLGTRVFEQAEFVVKDTVPAKYKKMTTAETILVTANLRAKGNNVFHHSRHVKDKTWPQVAEEIENGRGS